MYFGQVSYAYWLLCPLPIALLVDVFKQFVSVLSVEVASVVMLLMMCLSNCVSVVSRTQELRQIGRAVEVRIKEHEKYDYYTSYRKLMVAEQDTMNNTNFNEAKILNKEQNIGEKMTIPNPQTYPQKMEPETNSKRWNNNHDMNIIGNSE